MGKLAAAGVLVWGIGALPGSVGGAVAGAVGAVGAVVGTAASGGCAKK